MRRYLLRRLVRRVAGEPREPIRHVLDHRQPIAPVDREWRATDHLYGLIAAVCAGVIVCTLIIVYTRGLEQ
jgi:hypothetical protein